MKKYSLLCMALISLLIGSCTKSQFSTTSRHTKKGKVTYSNQYSNERIRRTKTRSLHVRLNQPGNNIDFAPISSAGVKNSQGPALLTSHPEEKLLASVSYDPGIILNRVQPSLTSSHVRLSEHKDQSGCKSSAGQPGTIKNQKGKNKPVPLKKNDSREFEKKNKIGFTFSLIGLIPVVGIPFAILAIIYGAKSLRNLKKYPGAYRGKGFAIASIILGGLGFLLSVFCIVEFIVALSAPWVIHLNMGFP